MKDLLKDKITIIIGASGAIGSSIALLFGEQGASIGIHYFKNREIAQKVSKSVAQNGSKSILLQVDITKYSEVERMVKEVIDKFGRIDIVINSAGIAKDNAIQFLSDSDWRDVIDVNLNGPFYVCKAVRKQMAAQKSGKIVNIASVTGLIGQELRTNYGASKGALIALTKSIARELAPFGIQVNAVAPQIVEGGLSLQASKKFITETAKFTPLGRIGKGIDVANAALFLSSDLSDFITGEVIYVTGGLFTHQI
ncbi:MAG: 3-oxoacyl-(acyl-carrier-protein) reductase FabG [candidate division WS2 bacterium]|nr:3-oxoacyl-(acyl-carrier-protein) reductase FabG [Candidatus Lithacetigena glycinireducens]